MNGNPTIAQITNTIRIACDELDRGQTSELEFARDVQQLLSALVTAAPNALWCVRTVGPDAVIPQPSHEAAVQYAEEANAAVAARPVPDGGYDAVVQYVVAPWPDTAEQHAAELGQ